MGHHDQDPGHGEPGHVHDENWNRTMMETDDPAKGDQDPGHGEPGHVHDENWNRTMMGTDDPPKT